MLLFTMLVLVGVSGALASPWLEMAQSQNIQAEMELNLPVEHLFSAFKRVHNKQYEDAEEETMRLTIFAVNIDYINQHNKKYQSGEKSFYLGVNQFTDLTHMEFMALYTGHLGKKPVRSNATTYIAPAYVVLPESVDWRTKGYVTPVKDQGQCGSCWAFSTTGSLEGQHMRKTGKLVSLSEQQLVDCSGSTGDEGCDGGFMDNAFQYIEDCGGIESETDYPYVAKDKKCTYDKSLEKAEVTGYTDVESGSEDALQNAVATVGPVSIAIDASHQSFQSYAGGVYDEPFCSSTSLDHGVLAAGYGVDAGEDYWLVKNSWAKTWGEEGYIRMSRNKDNQCGVATMASYPLV